MRPIISSLILLSVFSAREATAQEVIPRALYNPATGEVYFDNLDPIYDAGRGRLIFLSRADSLSEINLKEMHAGVLYLTPNRVVFPSVITQSSVLWQLGGPFDDAFEQPVYAGSIVEPGTDIEDLVIQSFWLNKEPLGEVVLIPEPSSLLLILGGGGVCAALGSRRRATLSASTIQCALPTRIARRL